MATISSRKISSSPAKTLTFPTGKSLNHSSGALLGRIHGLGISIPGLEVLVMTGHKFAIMSVVRRSLKGGVVMDPVDVNTGAPGEIRRADSNRALAGRLYRGTPGWGCL